MSARNPLFLAFAGFSALFVTVLLGVVAWVGIDSREQRSGPFNAAFSLVDDQGNPVDQSMFKGRPSLVYFGYTHCPEVCPTTLFEVTGYLKDLGAEGEPLKTYFFTVDPERDTQDVMHSYVNAFTDRITGVTGAPEEMRKVIDGWKVHASKVPGVNGSYSMSHTMSVLLIGADGRLKGLLPYGADQQDAVTRIRSMLL